ncbi:MAG: NAD+ synthase [Gammaproteobacteria bacterium]|nr:NAD+ synthase [Gammaproteobacteria bacterium]
MLNVVMAQISLRVGDIEGNAARIIDSMIKAKALFDADLVLFPELTLTGYPPEDLLLREELHRRVGQAVETIQQRFNRDDLRGTTAIIGLPWHVDGALYNSAAIIGHKLQPRLYHKQQLPNYSVFDEKRYFTAGSEPCLFTIKGIQVGITLCEDIWFAETVKQCKAAGAELILNLNASPFEYQKRTTRQETVSKRAVESGLPILYANLVGGQDELVFDGGSFVVNADGDITQQAPHFEEQLIPVLLERTGEKVMPHNGFISEEPSDNALVYDALVMGVRDYVTNNGFNGVVIGLSGGIDSALTLAIAVDALGAESVEAVSMPSRYTADMSINDARAQAENDGLNFRVIPIESVFNSFTELLSDEFAGFDTDTTEENIQARCRGVILMAISNKKGKMVLTTGNKSEMAVGYATLYGDMAGGFAALKDIPKMLVYELARYRNSISPVIPLRVIERPPSAELAPDQKDSDSLPEYVVLDQILEQLIEEELSVEAVINSGFDEKTVKRISRLVDINEYKRRQSAPGVKITSKAFGKERRYPITSAFGYRHR